MANQAEAVETTEVVKPKLRLCKICRFLTYNNTETNQCVNCFSHICDDCLNSDEQTHIYCSLKCLEDKQLTTTTTTTATTPQEPQTH